MKKNSKDKTQKLVAGELERVIDGAVILGLMPRPTEKEKIELVNGMYAIINDYSLLTRDVCKEMEDYNKSKERC